ncbi:MAG: hypothetical protein HUU50_06860 [Candidatus Brocadiae bacterium]|nr:hypothetical protein [Candidatus Brocadiia bacterium]
MAAEEIIAGAIATAGSSLGSIVVATSTATVPCAGIAGWLGFTTTVTTIVTLPVGGIIAAATLATYGAYKAYKAIQREEDAEKNTN